MKYPHIISKLYRGMWLIRESTHDAMLSAIEARLLGESSPAAMAETSTSPNNVNYRQYGDISIIRVFGILGKHLDSFEMMCGGCSMDNISEMLSAAEADPTVRNVLLHFHTPGGTVQGTPELAAEIEVLGRTKNTMAFTDGDCCSGGVYLASQCNQFYCTRSADIGSIGVRMVLLDLTRQMENDGVKVNAISSGKYKLSGASFKRLTPDERAMFQAESDRIYTQFKSAMLARRSVMDEDMQGQIFSGDIAAQKGFVDGVVNGIEDCFPLFPQPTAS